MATVIQETAYPTSDGRPMAETDWHRDIMFALIKVLQSFFAADRNVYVSGNLLLYYVRGNKRRHVSPRRIRRQRSGQSPTTLLFALGREEEPQPGDRGDVLFD